MADPVTTVDSLVQLKTNLGVNDSALKAALGAALPLATVTPSAATAVTPAANQDGILLLMSASAAIAVTLPNNLPAGYAVSFLQYGTGQMTFAAQSGGAMRNPDGHTKSRARYGMVTAIVLANGTGTTAEWLISGDTIA